MKNAKVSYSRERAILHAHAFIYAECLKSNTKYLEIIDNGLKVAGQFYTKSPETFLLDQKLKKLQIKNFRKKIRNSGK